ncbi:MAG TPA: response regulator [Chitinophagales bacterium]|nr:response regulator [Chitinophagales bacterium]
MNTSKNVFLVDDDTDDQLFFIEALSEIKNTTLYGVANNGKEALDKLENYHELPDLIFMDINMPVMNGIECLAELKEKPWMSHIPVIILSSDIAHADDARKLGAKAFIKKPSDFTTLRANLAQMINLDFAVSYGTANQLFPAQQSLS